MKTSAEFALYFTVSDVFIHYELKIVGFFFFCDSLAYVMIIYVTKSIKNSGTENDSSRFPENYFVRFPKYCANER